MSEWIYPALNGFFTLVCCWQASKSTDNRISSSLSKDGAARYFEWARREADRATGRN
jgi:hypothetical protein